MPKDGLTQMRSNPRSCCAYMPPMDVPTIKAGRSFATSALSIGNASTGSIGMSGARTMTLFVVRFSQ